MIGREDWLAAVRELEPANDQDSLTVRELAELFGLKPSAAKDRIAKLVANGQAVRTTKRFIDCMGRPQMAGAYRLVKATKKGK